MKTTATVQLQQGISAVLAGLPVPQRVRYEDVKDSIRAPWNKMMLNLSGDVLIYILYAANENWKGFVKAVQDGDEDPEFETLDMHRRFIQDACEQVITHCMQRVRKDAVVVGDENDLQLIGLYVKMLREWGQDSRADQVEELCRELDARGSAVDQVIIYPAL